MGTKMNSYELSRIWFDWCFENPTLIKPNHTALYFFCIEHCNRLGWKKHFGLPTTMTKEAIGIRSYNTFITTLNDLVKFGFLELVEKSKNQYSSNIIALSKFNKASNKALDKALIKHDTKQSESTGESIGSIDKQITINNEQYNNKPDLIEIFFQDLENSTHFEKLASAPGNSKEALKNFIPVFRDKANLEYTSFIKFVEHFKNAFNIYKIQKNGTGKQNNHNDKKSSRNELGAIADKILTGNNSHYGT